MDQMVAVIEAVIMEHWPWGGAQVSGSRNNKLPLSEQEAV